jgi:hypothetical protein
MANAKFRGYNRVKFQSLKLGRTVFCKSLFLRDYLLHLEWDDSIQSYELYPFKISYRTNNRHRTISPHVLLNNSEEQQIVVWLKSSLTDEENFQQTVKIITNFCESKGFHFAVKFPDEIRKEPFLSNLKLIRRYVRCEINFNHIRFCREFFENVSNPLLGNFIQFLVSKNEMPQTAYALLSQKIIETDIYSYPINPESPIQLKKQFPNFQRGRIAA